MSLLASIHVYQCNECGAIATVNMLDDAAEKRFKKSWYDGLVKDYCPQCKETENARYFREIERDAANRVFGRKLEKKEYVN